MADFKVSPQRLRIPALYACALALSLCSAAQDREHKSQQEQVVLRTASRLVQVNVVVRDKTGHPVTDLKQGDFVLLEAGKEQKLSFFGIENSQPAEGRATLPPNTFTNQRLGLPNSMTVILIDGLNTRIQDQIYARDQLVKFLQQIQPQDRVAIYTLDDVRVRVLHDFTDEAEPLLKALARYKTTGSALLQASAVEEPETGRAELDEIVRRMEQRSADYSIIERVQRSSRALVVIAHHLARFPARKNLIWVSASFPFSLGLESLQDSPQGRSFYPEIEQAARALNSANVALYPVDARGLLGPILLPFPTGFDALDLAADTGLGRAREQRLDRIASSRDPTVQTHQTMQVLAQRTGGRAFYNTNDIKGAVQRAIEDSRSFYTLGYYPTHDTWDGRFKEIKVQVKRKGLQVNHRRGYFAFSENVMDQKARDGMVRTVATNDLDASGVGLIVKLVPSAPDSLVLTVEILVNPKDIPFEEGAGKWAAAADLYLVQRDAEGKSLTISRQAIHLDLTRENYEKLMQQAFRLTKDLKLEPGAKQAVVVVRDSQSGAVGSVNFPLPAPAPSGSR